MLTVRHRRILFVDDEVRILEGIQRMLRPMREEWDVLVRDSGAKALELLASEKIDVVVSDMRMPGMDGAELLQTVMQRHPQVVRIILSGQADRDSLMRSLGATHQYLAKPCDPQRLRQAVAKACALRDLLHDEQLQRLVASLGTVPSLPTLYQRIHEELSKDEPSARVIGEIVAQDMGMSAKLLQLTNSARFGVSRQVNSAVDAVGIIGLGTVKSLVLGAHAFTTLAGATSGGVATDQLWQRALQVATLARAIATTLRLAAPTVDMAYTAGLLQDCGMLLLAVNRSAEYVAALGDATHPDLLAAERAHFSADHAAVGAYLLGLWGLPEPIVEAVAFHHRPMDAPITVVNPLVVVHVAGALIDEPAGGRVAVHLDAAIVERFNLAGHLDAWRRARTQGG
ncbi:MAG: HDOD domain-containing protein [Planctomycetes bacterium]|nr:HDOD domain-containing protein [Planctomycetota bacterium]